MGLFAQKVISLPEMEGTPDDDCAPPGWEVEEISPDIVEGNGPWPSGTYRVADVNGGNVSGKTMGLFLSADTTTLEGWKTTLTGLKKGEDYSFSFQWQQATLLSGSTEWYQGGEILVVVNGDSTVFKSDDDPENDTWQMANVSFKANNNVASVIIKIHISPGSYSGSYGGAVVIDNGDYCKECHEAGMW